MTHGTDNRSERRPVATGRTGGAISVRWRLTLVYSLIFVASGALLLTLVYLIVRQTQGGAFAMARPAGPYPTGVSTAPTGINPAGSQSNVIHIARDEAVTATLQQFLQWSILGLVVMTAASVGIGWILAGRVLAPIHTITAKAQRISAYALNERVALGGPQDELREMADTFDSLLDRIEEAFQSERRLVATMSHELRTPLANQQIALDVALSDPDATISDLRNAGQVALSQGHRANKTIDALLILARVQGGGTTPDHAVVELCNTIGEIVDEVAQSEAGSMITWRTDLDHAKVTGNRELINSAIANLVSNAATHNHPGGEVDVTLTSRADNATLRVSNTGPTVSPRDAADLVLPFRRGAADRTTSDRGVGLGLSITQAVTDYHQGSLTLTPGATGGLLAELTLPHDQPKAAPTSLPTTTPPREPARNSSPMVIHVV